MTGLPRSGAAGALVLAAALLVSGCAAPAGQFSDTSTSMAPASDEHDEGVPVVSWDAASEKAVRDTAAEVMGLFARPTVPEGPWFAALEPHLAADYAGSARYIDPARVPVSKVLEGPALSRDTGDPLTVTATFATDDGPWEVALHRTAQDAPWLVTDISPQNND